MRTHRFRSRSHGFGSGITADRHHPAPVGESDAAKTYGVGVLRNKVGHHGMHVHIPHGGRICLPAHEHLTDQISTVPRKSAVAAISRARAFTLQHNNRQNKHNFFMVSLIIRSARSFNALRRIARHRR